MKHKLIITTDLLNQNALDFDEMIEELESNNNLSSDHILDSLNKKIAIEKRKRLQSKLAIASLAACFMLVAAANWNSIHSYASELLGIFTFQTKDGTWPSVEVEPIHVNTPVLDNMDGENAFKEYSSLDECSKELGITFLKSNLAWDNTYEGKVSMVFPNTENGFSLVLIQDNFHIVGDLTNITLTEEGGLLSHGGEIYEHPVSLSITFLVGQGFINEYDQTYYNSTETYVGSNGIEAQILETSNDYRVYFFHENIKYEFRASVPLDELKRIIDSFE